MSMSVMAAGSVKPFLSLMRRNQWALPPPGIGLLQKLTICSEENSISVNLSSAFCLRSTRVVAAAAAPPTKALDRAEVAVKESRGKDAEFNGMENASLSHRDSREEEKRSSGLPLLRLLQRKIVRELSSFSLAIGELFAIAALSALGKTRQHRYNKGPRPSRDGSRGGGVRSHFFHQGQSLKEASGQMCSNEQMQAKCPLRSRFGGDAEEHLVDFEETTEDEAGASSEEERSQGDEYDIDDVEPSISRPRRTRKRT